MPSMPMVQPNAVVVADLLRKSMTDGKVPLLTVTSNSMSPLLQVGDQVGLSPATPEQLTPGDVIVLHQGHTFLTHRFCGRQHAEGRTLLLTRGDRPLRLDEPWTAEDYVGRVAIVRRAERVLPLDRGAGRWLNRHLARLAKAEAQLFSTGNLGWPARWVRRALFAYAIGVAIVCRRLGARPDAPHKSYKSANLDNQL